MVSSSGKPASQRLIYSRSRCQAPCSASCKSAQPCLRHTMRGLTMARHGQPCRVGWGGSICLAWSGWHQRRHGCAAPDLPVACTVELIAISALLSPTWPNLARPPATAQLSTGAAAFLRYKRALLEHLCSKGMKKARFQRAAGLPCHPNQLLPLPAACFCVLIAVRPLMLYGRRADSQVSAQGSTAAAAVCQYRALVGGCFPARKRSSAPAPCLVQGAVKGSTNRPRDDGRHALPSEPGGRGGVGRGSSISGLGKR